MVPSRTDLCLSLPLDPPKTAVVLWRGQCFSTVIVSCSLSIVLSMFTVFQVLVEMHLAFI